MKLSYVSIGPHQVRLRIVEVDGVDTSTGFVHIVPGYYPDLGKRSRSAGDTA
jgi:hypothetical protein